jgi:MFS family permease
MVGLALMALGLSGLAALVGSRSQVAAVACLAVFGLGFGMVGQILITAVQNDVDRRVLGVATAATSFVRGLGGAVGAALLGAAFAARAGGGTGPEVAEAVRVVFLAGAGIAVVALGVVLALREVPLRGPGR